jgi:HD superfamily phosphohydrolase
MQSVHGKTFLHLIRDYTEPIRDPLWKNIYVSKGMKKLISLAPFQKLGRIKQLGPAFHVYPGAVHTRLNHSLGVFHLARKLLLSLLEKEESSDSLRGELAFVSTEGVKSFLTAALFHDLGHFPFAHSLKELPLKSHEAIGAEGLTSEPIASTIRNELRCDPARVAAIIDEEIDPEGDEEVVFFRRLLSGVLDPDKLDYLNRDAYFCGVPYGIQDTEYVFHKILPHREWGISLERDGLTAVENILFSKYLMYSNVYWHRVVRIATAMIKRPLNMAMEEGKLNPADLYWLDDEEFFGRFSADRFRPYRLIGDVSSRRLYKTVYEAPYNEELHGKFLPLPSRLAESERIASALSNRLGRSVKPWEVIIDIPEPISFEIDLPIVDRGETLPFAQSGSVFSKPVVEGFTNSMRMLRIFAPESRAGDIRGVIEELV